MNKEAQTAALYILVKESMIRKCSGVSPEELGELVSRGREAASKELPTQFMDIAKRHGPPLAASRKMLSAKDDGGLLNMALKGGPLRRGANATGPGGPLTELAVRKAVDFFGPGVH